MTDNEIIKALECCNNDGYEKCKNECPFYSNCIKEEKLSTYALDLINRQKAKIEALQMDNQQLQSDIANANMNADYALAEIERLKEKHRSMQISLDHQVYVLRVAKAIKDFLQKQEIELANNTDISAVGYQSIIAINDKILKEMVGEA